MSEKGPSPFPQKNIRLVSKTAQEVETNPEVENNERAELVMQKVAAARNFSRDYLNSIPEKNYGRLTNLYLVGQILALSIYSPNNITNLQEYLAEHPESRADIDIITQPLPRPNLKLTQEGDKLFDYEAFAREFAAVASEHNLPNRPEYEGKSYDEIVHFKGAKKAIDNLLHEGPVTAWTAGDQAGVPEEELEGSNEQNKRMKSGGLDTLMEKHQEKVLDTISLHARRSEHRENGFKFKMEAAEDKFKLLEKIYWDYKRQGVLQYAIIDDKITNLDQAKEKLARLGVPEENILLIWDRQGSGAEGSDAKTPKGINPENIPALEEKYHAIFDITELHSTILNNTPLVNLGEPIGTIIDHDDVISNTKKASEVVGKNIEDWLKEKEII